MDAAPYTHFFISNAQVRPTTRSPHPIPLPRERVKHGAPLEHWRAIRFADRLATTLPLLEERAGVRGNRAGFGRGGSWGGPIRCDRGWSRSPLRRSDGDKTYSIT